MPFVEEVLNVLTSHTSRHCWIICGNHWRNPFRHILFLLWRYFLSDFFQMSFWGAGSFLFWMHKGNLCAVMALLPHLLHHVQLLCSHLSYMAFFLLKSIPFFCHQTPRISFRKHTWIGVFESLQFWRLLSIYCLLVKWLRIKFLGHNFSLAERCIYHSIVYQCLSVFYILIVHLFFSSLVYWDVICTLQSSPFWCTEFGKCS